MRKIIAVRLSKAAPLTAEGRRAIAAQAAEAEAAMALVNVTDAIADRNPELTREECRSAALRFVEETAHRVRAGEFVIVSHTDRLCHALYDGDAEFVKAVTEAATPRQAGVSRAKA